MGAIIDFFSSIIDGVTQLFEAIGRFFVQLADFVYYLSVVGQKVPEYLTFLPGSVILVLTITLAVVILFKILGRT